MQARNPAIQWTVVGILLLAAILVPFVALEGLAERVAVGWQQGSADGAAAIGLATVVLLAADVVLPIPSSVVSTAAGFLLGVSGGAIASFTGLMLGSLFGYWLGARAARPALDRLVSAEQRERFSLLTARFGEAAIIIARPVPVLAEASVILGGAARMPLRSFLATNVVANAAVAITYAAAGAISASSGSVLIALAILLIVPASALLLRRKLAT